MVGRIYRAKKCIDYEKSALSAYPKINLKLLNVRLEEYPSTLSFVVDTGFEGSILVKNDVYEFFEVGELPRKYWRTYSSMAGLITMKVAKAIVWLGENIKIETYVETPLLGTGKMLVGRELLNKVVIILDGARKQACIADTI
jgi:clan AA aspartic protease